MKRSNIESFIDLPTYHGQRSGYDLSHKVLTTMNVGDLVPLGAPIEVIPGDTFKVRTNSYIKMTTLLEPVYDTLICDIYWFYVPFRILWDDYIYWFGENKIDPYDSIGVYSMPQVEFPENGWEVGTIANYMQIPIGRKGYSNSSRVSTVNALMFRGYADIVNEFFISDWLDSKANVNYDVSATVTGSNGSDYVSDLVLGGKCFVVNKLHDKFTSCLPKPSAGEPVALPLGDNAFVYAGEENLKEYESHYYPNSFLPIKFANGLNAGHDAFDYRAGGLQSNSNGQLVVNQGSVSADKQVNPTNLYADLSTATATTINDLRYAIAVQQMLESESVHGNRYFSQLVGDYGVVNPDGRLQRPEYLGGARFTLNVNMVVQNSETASTPQGNITAYSVTSFAHTDFIKSITEPGMIYRLACIRYPHTYSQGLPKLFTKKDKYDFFNKHFDGIGEQPIYTSELYLSGTSDDDSVFGYMPYGTEYRKIDNVATGEMSVDYAQSLDSYHFGDKYNTSPKLSSSWLKEDKSNVDRALTYSSDTVMQFQCNFSFGIEAYRPMSRGQLPGLRRL